MIALGQSQADGLKEAVDQQKSALVTWQEAHQSLEKQTKLRSSVSGCPTSTSCNWLSRSAFWRTNWSSSFLSALLSVRER